MNRLNKIKKVLMFSVSLSIVTFFGEAFCPCHSTHELHVQHDSKATIQIVSNEVFRK